MPERQHINVNLVLVLAGTAGVAYLIYKSTQNVKGLLSNPLQDQAIESTKSNPAWDPNYWQQFGNPPGTGNKLLYWSQIIPIAQALYNDLGNFYIPWLFSTANPSAVVADVQQIKNKPQFSQLVWYFSKNFNEDLFTKMYKQLLGGASGTPAATLSRVLDYVNSLPS